MIQSYEQLNSQINKINSSLDSKGFIQKIYSSSFYISIAIRVAGKTHQLCIGRGGGKEGLWLAEDKVDARLRKIDKLLEYVRRHLSGSTFLRLEMDSKDRIFCLKYAKWGRENSFYFFYNARNLYFSNDFYDNRTSEMKLFKSWAKKPETSNELNFANFDEVGRIELPSKSSSKGEVQSIDRLFKDEEKQALVHNSGGKSKKFLTRKLKKITADLDRVSNWSDLQKTASMEQDFATYEHKSNINNILIKFKYKDHYKRRDEVFDKVKKLKKAEKILNLRLEDTEESIKKYGTKDSYTNTLRAIAPVWYKGNSRQAEAVKLDDEDKFRVLKFETFDLGIGESAVGNDQLRKKWAKKDDVWFHLDGDKSPHGIIKLKNGALDMTLLTLIGSVILDYSTLTYSEANLIYTQVKNLKGVKGVAGSVNYKKEKRVTVIKKDDWKDQLL